MGTNDIRERTMTLTLTDLFCGAGGSSTGAISVPGVEVAVASNHWQLAIETHNTNHPEADHICADLSQIDPRLFRNTDLLWASPSCTKHSVAQGKRRQDAQPDLFGETLPDEAAERSRATMWDVVRFAEYHDYEAVIVENVVEVYLWPPFQSWLMAMRSLGYVDQIVYLNSMHAQLIGTGAPQSRDRIYIVWTKAKNKRPDLTRVVSPNAVCSECGPIRALQSWKRLDRAPWGKYRSQYVYRCPNVKCRNQIVEPLYRPASDIIDWSLVGTRLGDRKRPLAAKTMARIRAGIERYWGPILVEAAGNTYDAADPRHPAYGRPDGYMRAWPTDDPLRTVHTTMSKALAIPVEGREGKGATPMSEALRTMTTRNETGLLVPCGGTWRDEAASLTEAMSTRTTRETDGVAFAPFIAELRGGSCDARAIADPLSTVAASGNHHGLVTSYYGKGGTRTSDDALPTVTAMEKHALLMRNNTARGDQGQMSTPVSEYIRTVTTSGHQSLLTAGRPTIDVNDVYFRMLEPREIVAAMDFPEGYTMLGNRREQVRLAGNAVTPCAARDLVGAVVETLHGSAA